MAQWVVALVSEYNTNTDALFTVGAKQTSLAKKPDV